MNPFVAETVRRFARMWNLLSRIPLPGLNAKDLPEAADLVLAPIAGALVALPATLLAVTAGLFTDCSIAAWLALVLYIVSGWSLHLDGLADMADALGSGARGELALTIMKDSRAGTFGVIALVASLVLWGLLTGNLLERGLFVAIPLSAGSARAGLCLTAWRGSSPFSGGTGKPLVEGFDGGLFLASVAATGLLLPLAPKVWLLCLAGGLAGGGLVETVSRETPGGVTGDVLGASAVAGELLALLAVVLFA